MIDFLTKTCGKLIPDFLIKPILRKTIKYLGVGELHSLDINAPGRKIMASITLAGETAPIAIHIHDYHMKHNQLTIYSMSCDKPWIHALIQQFVLGKAHPIPQKYSSLVEGIIT